ncbi:MAG: glycosyltransferase family 2 protein, partial [Chitinophagaceae bacterium]|nr:glycosyltransferase family 2 protein [Chitinophagaceae bacterium]
MLTTPKVAVVLLNYNGQHWLQQFLPGVLATDYSALEVIVADNASTDDSIQWLTKEYPGVRTIQLKENAGYAGGYNMALQKIDAKYFVLLNTDVYVEHGWLLPLVTCMESDPSIGAAQPRIRAYHNRSLFEYAGAAGGWIDVLGYPFARGRVFDRIEADIGQYNDTVEIFWASGACFCVRRDAFEKAKGFDADFFAHQEEIDLCWRLQLLGYRIVACGSSEVYHVGGGTLPVGGRKVMLNFRNNLIMLSRNLPTAEKIWVIPARWILDVIAA